MNKSRSLNGKAGRAALFARVDSVPKTEMMTGGDFPSAWNAVKSAASAVAPVAKELAQDGAQAILRTITARLEALLRGASKPEETVAPAVALAASPVKSKIRRNMKVRGAGMCDAKGSGIGGAAAKSAEDAALASYAQWLSGAPAPAPAPAPAVGGFILERLNKLVRGAGGSAFDGLNKKRKRAPAKDGDKRKARGAVIAKLMRENPGMTLGAASVHAKQNGMY